MKTLVIINGLPRSGKDTAVAFMVQELARYQAQVRTVSAIDGVRTLLHQNGFDTSAKTPKDRKLLAAIGDALEDYCDFKSTSVVETVTGSGRNTVVFAHVREPAMIDKIMRLAYSAEPGLMILTLFVKGRGETEASNANDAEVGNYNYDLELDNAGTLESLQTACRKLVDDVICPMALLRAA